MESVGGSPGRAARSCWVPGRQSPVGSWAAVTWGFGDSGAMRAAAWPGFRSRAAGWSAIWCS